MIRKEKRGKGKCGVRKGGARGRRGERKKASAKEKEAIVWSGRI